MEVSQIISEIDAQIAKLQQARDLLQGTAGSASTAVKGRRGRPRKDAAAPTAAKKAGSDKSRRNLSPEARKRIADAQKRRWAASRNA